MSRSARRIFPFAKENPGGETKKNVASVQGTENRSLIRKENI